MSTDDLDESLELILDSLPDHHEGEQRRKHVLTRCDAELIAGMIKIAARNQGCSIGLNSHQVAALTQIPAQNMTAMNDMVKERKRLLAALGTLTLAALAFIGQWLFSTIPWRRLGHWFTTGAWA